MSASSYKRLFLAGLSILFAWTLIDVLAHRLFLTPIYASTPHLWRRFDQMNVALISTVTFGLIAIFVASYRLLVRPRSLRAGLLLGLILGTSVGFGTNIHAPIPLALAWGWFTAGPIKGVAAGAIVGALVTEG